MATRPFAWFYSQFNKALNSNEVRARVASNIVQSGGSADIFWETVWALSDVDFGGALVGDEVAAAKKAMNGVLKDNNNVWRTFKDVVGRAADEKLNPPVEDDLDVEVHERAKPIDKPQDEQALERSESAKSRHNKKVIEHRTKRTVGEVDTTGDIEEQPADELTDEEKTAIREDETPDVEESTNGHRFQTSITESIAKVYEDNKATWIQLKMDNSPTYMIMYAIENALKRAGLDLSWADYLFSDIETEALHGDIASSDETSIEEEYALEQEDDGDDSEDEVQGGVDYPADDDGWVIGWSGILLLSELQLIQEGDAELASEVVGRVVAETELSNGELEDVFQIGDLITMVNNDEVAASIRLEMVEVGLLTSEKNEEIDRYIKEGPPPEEKPFDTAGALKVAAAVGGIILAMRGG